jgi:hypothetical protein
MLLNLTILEIDRIGYRLGRPVQDQVVARGARSGDQFCVYDLPASRLGCITIDQASVALPMAARPTWAPDVVIKPASTTSVRVSVGDLPAGLHLQAWFYPTEGPVNGPKPLVATEQQYVTTFALTTPSLGGYVRVQVVGDASRDIVSDYGLGGSPANRAGGRGFAPILSPDGQVLLYHKDQQLASGQFYTLQAATRIPPPPAWATVIGQAYRLNAAGGASLAISSLNFSYLGTDVPAGEERWVTIYFWNGSAWESLATKRDSTLNQAVAATRGPGLYVLMSSVEIPLVKGVNFIAYPVQENRSVRAAMASITGTYTMVRGYDSASGRWQTFVPGLPDEVNTLKQLEFGHGYEVTASQNIILRLKGSAARAGISTTQARPQVSPPATFYAIFQANAPNVPASGAAVIGRVNGRVCGQTQTVAAGGYVGFLLDVAGDSANTPGCGAPGSDVTITLDNQTWHADWNVAEAQELRQ